MTDPHRATIERAIRARRWGVALACSVALGTSAAVIAHVAYRSGEPMVTER